MFLQIQSCSRQFERSRSLVIIHTPRLCDGKAPDHLEVHSGDWQSESARSVVRWYGYVREAGNLSTAVETDSGRQRWPDRIKTLNYFCASLGSCSICPGNFSHCDRSRVMRRGAGLVRWAAASIECPEIKLEFLISGTDSDVLCDPRTPSEGSLRVRFPTSTPTSVASRDRMTEISSILEMARLMLTYDSYKSYQFHDIRSRSRWRKVLLSFSRPCIVTRIIGMIRSRMEMM